MTNQITPRGLYIRTENHKSALKLIKLWFIMNYGIMEKRNKIVFMAFGTAEPISEEQKEVLKKIANVLKKECPDYRIILIADNPTTAPMLPESVLKRVDFLSEKLITTNGKYDKRRK
jgi:hypothetical protein